MIEVIARRASATLTTYLYRLLRHRWLLLVCVVAGSTAFVGGRFRWVESQRPAHRVEIATAYGSAREFYGPPQMNHAGNRLAFVATADTRGSALFVCDIASGQKQELVCDRQGSGYWKDTFNLRVWSWSPDDQAVAYSVEDNLYYCPVDTNHPPVVVITHTNAVGLSDVVWVSPSELAWREGKTICDARQQADGSWETRSLPLQGQVQCLTAIDEHTIAWLQEDYLCRFDLRQEIADTNSPPAARGAGAYVAPATNDLVLWLDASTLRLTNGAPVSLLLDQSPKRNHANISHRPPTFNGLETNASLGGRGTIHFSSSSTPTNATGLKTYRKLGLSGSAERSVFAVMRRAPNRAMLITIGSTNTVGGFFGLYDQSDALYLPMGYFKGFNNPDRIRSLPSSWHILEAIFDGRTTESYVNGGRVSTIPLQYVTTDKEVELGLCTGARAGTVDVGSEGDFAELLIYGRALSLPEQRQVEAYLGAKWFGAMPLSPQNPLVWLDPQMEGLTSFSWSRETGRLLLTRSENGRDSIFVLTPGNASPGRVDETSTPLAADSTSAFPSTSAFSLQPVALSPSLQPSALSGPTGRYLQEAHWTGPETFACTSRDPNHSSLVLSDLNGNRQDLLQRGDLKWFSLTPDRKQVLFLGNLSHEPCPGIWRYEIASSTLRPLVPGTDHPSEFAKEIVSFRDFIQVDQRRRINYTIYPPANFDRRQKYPSSSATLSSPTRFTDRPCKPASRPAALTSPWWNGHSGTRRSRAGRPMSCASTAAWCRTRASIPSGSSCSAPARRPNT